MRKMAGRHREEDQTRIGRVNVNGAAAVRDLLVAAMAAVTVITLGGAPEMTHRAALEEFMNSQLPTTKATLPSAHTVLVMDTPTKALDHLTRDPGPIQTIIDLLRTDHLFTLEKTTPNNLRRHDINRWFVFFFFLLFYSYTAYTVFSKLLSFNSIYLLLFSYITLGIEHCLQSIF